MITLKKLISAGVLYLLITGCLSAQTGGLPAQGPIPFEYFDRDNNGFVTEEEFNRARGERMAQRSASGRLMRNAANAPTFAHFDSDANGKLSPEELNTGHKMRMRQHQQRMGRWSEESRHMRMLDFSEVDLDGSGTISNPEFIQARSRVMNEALHQAPSLKNAAKAPDFVDIDVNKNGVIDPGEFRSHQLQH